MKKILSLITAFVLCTTMWGAEVIPAGEYAGTWYRHSISQLDGRATKATSVVVSAEKDGKQTITFKGFKCGYQNDVAVDIPITVTTSNGSCTIAKDVEVGHTNATYGKMYIRTYANYTSSVNPNSMMITFCARYYYYDTDGKTEKLQGMEYEYIQLNPADWTDWVAFPAADKNAATWTFSASNAFKSLIDASCDVTLMSRTAKENANHRQYKVCGFQMKSGSGKKVDLVFDENPSTKNLTFTYAGLGFYESTAKQARAKMETGSFDAAKGIFTLNVKYVYENAWKAAVAETLAIHKEEPVEKKALYLKAGSVDYMKDNAVVYAYCWGGADEDEWSKFEYVEKETIAVTSIAEDRTGMKIVRFAPGTTTPSWQGTIWNQTGDIAVSSDFPEKVDMIELSAWDGATAATWSKYTKPEPAKYYLVGDFCGWDVKKSVLFEKNAKDTLEVTVENISDSIKVICNQAWDVNYGAWNAPYTLSVGADYGMLCNKDGDPKNFVLDKKYIEATFQLYEGKDGKLYIKFVSGTPVKEPVKYYAKNNWNGAAEWSWKEMTKKEEAYVLDSVVFGGTGVNINTKEEDADAKWFDLKKMKYNEQDTIQALDTVRFELSISDKDTVLTAIKLGRPAPAPRKEFVFVAGEAADSDPALFAITWGKDGSNETVKLANKADDIYTAEILETVDSLVLVRCASDAAEIIWDGEGKNVWNQTANYALCDTMYFGAWVDDSNLFTITCEAPKPVEVKYYITGNAALVGEDKAWDAQAIEMTDGAYTFTALPAGEYEMKITNGAWDPEGQSWGAEALSEECSAGVDKKDGNIHFIVETPNDVTVTFAQGYVVVTGDFKNPQPADEGFGIILSNGSTIKGQKNEGQVEFEEYVTVADLTAGATFQLYDFANEAAWTVDNIDEASTPNLTINEDYVYEVTADGKYTIYLKMYGMGNDQVYCAYEGTGTNLNKVKAAQGQRFNVLGLPVDANYRGVVIMNGQTYLQ